MNVDPLPLVAAKLVRVAAMFTRDRLLDAPLQTLLCESAIGRSDVLLWDRATAAHPGLRRSENPQACARALLLGLHRLHAEGRTQETLVRDASDPARCVVTWRLLPHGRFDGSCVSPATARPASRSSSPRPAELFLPGVGAC